LKVYNSIWEKFSKAKHTHDIENFIFYLKKIKSPLAAPEIDEPYLTIKLV
jgi:hypothetical protein